MAPAILYLRTLRFVLAGALGVTAFSARCTGIATSVMGVGLINAAALLSALAVRVQPPPLTAALPAAEATAAAGARAGPKPKPAVGLALAPQLQKKPAAPKPRRPRHAGASSAIATRHQPPAPAPLDRKARAQLRKELSKLAAVSYPHCKAPAKVPRQAMHGSRRWWQ
ncbi:hypothetical protein HYH03_008633 [Edaphochlamys debaryana]|uniref:Uncharacterized protein n=1 Tax=Edaphochlamys debaryana TaxID=47281 RepID=A0A836BZA7_9CHLO|nr:hypothetical protein HYH03_008633 [Edaphochlamys debaryana]|eukprot:KAG2493213.1 hypothetical protein HYH03_008633 [Edaphochlamys debaryana]